MTPEEQEAERVRLEKASADEKARAEKEAAAKPKRNYKLKDAPVEGGPNSTDRIRAFEDEVFGRRAVRMNGQIERGVGSPYSQMTDERKAQYAALEDIVAAEQRLNDATAAAAVAEADRVAAEERLAMCEKVAQEKAAVVEAEKAEDDKAAQEKASKDKALAAG